MEAQPSARRNELYPLGFFGLLFVNTLFNQWIVFSHSSGSGTGALLLAGFVLQGLANPAIGHGSDWVRRRPRCCSSTPGCGGRGRPRCWHLSTASPTRR